MPRSVIACRRTLAFALLSLTLLMPVLRAETARQFDVPTGQANKTLKQFAREAELSIVYNSRSLKGIRTHEVVGFMIPSDALGIMLENTPLVFVRDDETGAFAVTKVEIPDEKATPSKSLDDGPSGTFENNKTTSMNKEKFRIGRTLKTLLTLVVASSPHIEAQEEEDEVFTLSPFTVDASGDEGYRATNTLAGSRLNTSLGDIANAVSVFTSEFITDLGAVSEEDLMAYSSTAVPELTDAAGTGVQGIRIGEAAFQFRLRGQLGSRARNYFRTVLRPDTYNADRFDESRGPNSILFGIGGAGGIVNTSTKQASTARNFGSFEIKVGSRDLLRSHLDYNKAITENFAIRINALYHDEGGWRPHEFKENNRLHIASTIRLAENTTLRLETEQIDAKGSTLRNYMPFDNITLWLENDSPTVPNGNQAGNPSIGIGRRNANQRVTLVGNDNTFRNFQQTVFSVAGAGNSRSVFFDSSIAPFDAYYPGEGAFRDDDMEGFSAVLESQPIENLFVELAVTNEDAITAFYDTTHEVNRVIGEPGGTFRDGDVNPYQGMLYFDTRWVLRYADNSSTRYRASASYTLDMGERMGRHNFAAMYSVDHNDLDRHVSFLTLQKADGSGAAFNAAAEHARNRLWTRNYVEDPSDLSQYAAPSWEDVPSQVSVVLNSGATPSTFDTIWAPNELTSSEEDIKSTLVSGQSYFLKDRLVATYGWRNDKKAAFSKGIARNEANAIIRDDLGRRTLASDYTASKFSADTIAYGLVGKLNSKVSLLYNKSENFNIPSSITELVPDGRLRPIVQGEGEDVGVMLNLMDGKLFARLAYFESSAIDDAEAFGAGSLVARNDRILDALVSEGSMTVAEADSRRITGGGWDLFDRTTSGWEVNLTANPTANWRIALNFSDTDTVPNNMLKQARIAWDLLEPQWSSYPQDLETDGTIDGEPRTIAGETQEWLDWFANTTAVEGEATLGSRQFQARLFTRYEFSEGPIKGAFVGGGYRYSGAPVIGRAATGELWMGEVIREVDLLFGYKTKVNWFGDKSQVLILQFNANDLLQENDYIGIRREAAGNLWRGRIVAPERYSFSAKLRF